jgi:predicted metal-dependent phosphoesterase TrpH
MILIDMHVHSNYSDGTLSVDSIVKAAKKRHLAFVGLTDHDTTDGLGPFMSACKQYGMEGLAGIELSADSDYTLHILGFRIDRSNAALQKKLYEIRDHRNARNHRICKKLQDLGFDIQIEEVTVLSRGQVIARPHIARLMMQRGYVSSMGEAFTKYIGYGGSAHVERMRLSAEECISLINDAGGLAVLAHPAQTYLEDDKMDRLLSHLKNNGLWGLEALYSGHSPEQIYHYLKMADKFDLYPTAGSDFHGTNSHGVELGVAVSEDFLPWARLGVKI